MNGFLNIYKPQGMSSAQVVGQVKRKIKQKHVGHMGTLDPMAEGVLPIAVGKACRLFDYLLDKQKTYVADFSFGYETDTLDTTGKILKEGGVVPTESEIRKVLPELIGEVEQIPPLFSAKNVGGKRGYQLARKGLDFTLPPKLVNIYNIELTDKINENTYRFTIDCGGGTYIRSICRDMAEKLDTFATMSKLIRTRSGVFCNENAVSLEDFLFTEDINSLVTPADEVVFFEKKKLSLPDSKKLLNGLPLAADEEGGLYRVYAEDEFWGVGEVKDHILTMRTYVRES